MEEYELVDINGNKTEKNLTHNEISKMSDDQLYSDLMEQYIPWLQAMGIE